jgi:hypothetical protein
MVKKPSLAAALRQSSEPQTETGSTRKKSANTNEETKAASGTPSNRIGKKSITGWFDADVLKQLKMIGLETDKSIQQMVGEALNDFFAKHGKSQIAR